MNQLEAFSDEAEPAVHEGVPLARAGAQSEDDVDDLSTVRAESSATDWTVETIVSQLRKGRIDLAPNFQRRAAWTELTKSRFIESAILNYPIPQLVLADNPDRPGHFLVIDGKQRLLALRQFYVDSAEPRDNEFEPLRLTGLSILNELKGWDIGNVQAGRPDLFDQFENHTIRTVVVRNWTSDSFLYTLFLRLNTGSVPLSPQELRQALVPGPFVDYVDDASGDSLGLQALLGNDGPDRRMVDAELLVRFLGFRLGPVEYRGNLKAFLDRTCKAFNERWNHDARSVTEQVTEMELAIAAAIEIFGPDGACHKWSESGRWERGFNRAVFDVQIGSLADPETRELALNNGPAMQEAFKQLCLRDADFSRAISTTTKSLDNTRSRFTSWYGAVGDITGATQRIPACIRTAGNSDA